MVQLNFSNIRISSITCAVPDFIQTFTLGEDRLRNRYLKNFIKQTGVKQRHISLTEQTALDLGFIALQRALQQAQWDKNTLDLLIFDTQTPDFMGGTCNALLLHHYLDLKESCLAFDMPLGCSAFIYTLSAACSYLQQPNIKRAAVVMGDTQWCTYKNKEEILAADHALMGEAAGVLLLERIDNNAAPITLQLGSSGHGYKHLCHFDTGIKNCWRHYPEKRLPNGEKYCGGNYMDGLEISLFAASKITEEIKRFCELNRLTTDQIDALILHQANRQIIENMLARLDIDASKVPLSLENYGNTSAASSIVTICSALNNADAEKLHLLCCCFGIGLSWGIGDMFIDRTVIAPIESTDFVLTEHLLQPWKE